MTQAWENIECVGFSFFAQGVFSYEEVDIWGRL